MMTSAQVKSRTLPAIQNFDRLSSEAPQSPPEGLTHTFGWKAMKRALALSG